MPENKIEVTELKIKISEDKEISLSVKEAQELMRTLQDMFNLKIIEEHHHYHHQTQWWYYPPVYVNPIPGTGDLRPTWESPIITCDNSTLSMDFTEKENRGIY